jgi:hypothetical protein
MKKAKLVLRTKDYPQENFRKFVFVTECENPLEDPSYSKWIESCGCEILSLFKCKEGFIALAHLEAAPEIPVLPCSAIEQSSLPSPDLPVA